MVKGWLGRPLPGCCAKTGQSVQLIVNGRQDLLAPNSDKSILKDNDD
jgi:hypothetical protein